MKAQGSGEGIKVSAEGQVGMGGRGDGGFVSTGDKIGLDVDDVLVRTGGARDDERRECRDSRQARLVAGQRLNRPNQMPSAPVLGQGSVGVLCGVMQSSRGGQL